MGTEAAPVQFYLGFRPKGSNGDYTEVTQIESLEPNELSADDIEVKTNASGRVKEKRAGWGDSGSYSGTRVLADDENATLLSAIWREEMNWKAILSDAATGTALVTDVFDGYVKSTKATADLEDVLKEDFAVTVSHTVIRNGEVEDGAESESSD